jgi:hypothetical protein
MAEPGRAPGPGGSMRYYVVYIIHDFELDEEKNISTSRLA